MKARAVTVFCLGLVLAGAVLARPAQEEDRTHGDGDRGAESQPRPAPSQPGPRQQGGFTPRESRQAPPAAPAQLPAPPAPPAAPAFQPPRLGVPQNSAPGGSDPARGHWSTGGARRDDARRDESRRDEARREEAWRANEAQRGLERRAGESRDFNRVPDRDGDRDRSGYRAPNAGRGAPLARRDYQWRDFDRYRAENFRFDGARYHGRSRFRIGDYYWPRGYARNIWIIGTWLPSVFFLDARYQLVEYWRFGLYDPPVGCHWIRIGYDALLVDDFTGEVLDEVYDLFW